MKNDEHSEKLVCSKHDPSWLLNCYADDGGNNSSRSCHTLAIPFLVSHVGKCLEQPILSHSDWIVCLNFDFSWLTETDCVLGCCLLVKMKQPLTLHLLCSMNL